MDNAGSASSSSDSKLSSTFQRPSNQSNTYRIQGSNNYLNSEGDIVE